jgi:hypothetical protein
MGVGYPKGWVANRTTLDESPSMSKAVRRYGVDGAKGDFPHGTTGGYTAHESALPPSAPAHSNTDRVPPGGVVKTVGFAPDGSGRHATPDYTKTTRAHGSDGQHNPATSTDGASGQAHSASGGKFGKATQRPGPAGNTGTRRMDHGALAGESGERPGYMGGKGPIRP